MNWVQNLVVKLFHITPAAEKQINIHQAYTFQENIQKIRYGITVNRRSWSSSLKRLQGGIVSEQDSGQQSRMGK